MHRCAREVAELSDQVVVIARVSRQSDIPRREKPLPTGMARMARPGCT